jgi:undecaprenyl-diphosphatase
VIEKRLGSIPVVALSLVVFALLLWWADRLPGPRHLDRFGSRDALLMGTAQVLALNPGTSRSGITITAGRWLRFNRDAAARISFLMSLPVTLGAIVYKVGGLVLDGVPPGLGWPMVAGIVASGLSGWLAVWGTLRLVRTRSFTPFVVYRLVVAALLIGLLASPWR